jgi:hypothetical protein
LPLTFELIRLRFHYRAAQPLRFPPNKAGNMLRGAFGMMLRETADAPDYARIFAPTSGVSAPSGPSGLADSPRPFVFRAAHLNGGRILPAAEFHFDVHLFDAAGRDLPLFIASFSGLAARGFGSPRGRAELLSVDRENIAIDLAPPPEPAARILVQFVTPTELKGADRPEFAVLFARLRDRISTLRALYGPGPLDIDFRAMGERAARVTLARCDLAWHDVERHSSRTGQIHPLSGFTGQAEYQAGSDGDLAEFLPYLRAGQWTGVGRQTVWGKGEICFQLCS